MFYRYISSSYCLLFKLVSSGIIITVLFFSNSYLAQQNTPFIGTFTKCEIKSKGAGGVFPGALRFPNDTIITSSSSFQIPILIEAFETSFSGVLEVEFPVQTSVGIWTGSPSKISLDNPFNTRVKLSGTWVCTDGSTTYAYDIWANTAFSPLEGPCSGRSENVRGNNLQAGNYSIEAQGVCSFSLFETPAPFEGKMTKSFTAGFQFSFTKLYTGTTSFNTGFEFFYLFEQVTGPIINLSETTLNFESEPFGAVQNKIISLSNSGAGQLDFTIAVSTSDGSNWLEVFPSSGSLLQAQSTELDVSVNPASLEKGEYHGQLSISAPNTRNSPAIVEVSLKITENSLSLKFDPPRIKCGEWTTLEIKVVDENNNLVSDYDGGAKVRLLKNLSKEKITKMPEFQSVLITDGKAQPIFIFTPEESFHPDSTITNSTILSGKIVIEVRLENSTIPPDTIEMIVYSPIDFFIDRIEVQQGVKDTDKDVTLEYKPGENRLFLARSFINYHRTAVRAFVNYRKTIDIPFSSIDYELQGNLNIFSSFGKQGPYIMGQPSFVVNPPPSPVRDTFYIHDRSLLKDALFKLLPAQIFSGGSYFEFEVELILDDLYQDEDEIANNKKTFDAQFTRTKGLPILAASAKLDDEYWPEIDLALFHFVKDVFPIEWYKFFTSDPNVIGISFKSGALESPIEFWNHVLYLLNRYNEMAAPGQQYECILTIATEDLMKKLAQPGARGVSIGINGKACVVNQYSIEPRDIAHELGHLLGLKETHDVSLAYSSPLALQFFSGDPNPTRSNANDYGNWVEEGNINFIELRQALGQNRYHDIMSWRELGVSDWTDRVTWDYLYKKFALSPLNKSQLHNETSGDGYIAISGSISESDSVILNPIIKMTQVPMLDDTLDGSYLIEFYNAMDQLIASYKFNVIFLMPGVRETSIVPFGLYLPFDNASKKLVIKKLIPYGDSKILSQRIFSDNAPEVQIISPEEGDSLTENFIIKWSAFDPDGDELTFDISYSPDGTTEILIASNLIDTVFTWNTAAYQGCTNGFITVIANDGINDGKARVGSLTDIKFDDQNNIKITALKLEQNYPNPFNPSTVIKWHQPSSGYTKIKVYDILGREIATLVNEEKLAGTYTVNFSAINLPSGVYFYTIKAGTYFQTKKMILMR